MPSPAAKPGRKGINMDKNSICDFDLVASMVRSAEKVFVDECGSETDHWLSVDMDCFYTCMDVVKEIVLSLFSTDCWDYFVSLRDSKYKYYFGGKKSE